MILMLALVFALAGNASAGCDINGDGRIGLEEAIQALQVTANIKPSEFPQFSLTSYWPMNPGDE